MVKPIYSEITGDINSFDNMGMQCLGCEKVKFSVTILFKKIIKIFIIGYI